MKKSIFFCARMQTQSLVANIKITKFILRTVRKIPSDSTCLLFSNARGPAVITHKEQLRQDFLNIMCKSAPSSSENLGARALSELWGGDFIARKIYPMLERGSVEKGIQTRSK